MQGKSPQKYRRLFLSAQSEIQAAAVVYRQEAHDRQALADFAGELADSGCRIGGMVQQAFFDQQGRRRELRILRQRNALVLLVDRGHLGDVGVGARGLDDGVEGEVGGAPRSQGGDRPGEGGSRSSRP